MMEKQSFINSLIDKAINFSETYLSGLQAPDVWVPEEMIDETKPLAVAGIIFWKPIPVNLDMVD